MNVVACGVLVVASGGFATFGHPSGLYNWIWESVSVSTVPGQAQPPHDLHCNPQKRWRKALIVWPTVFGG